jgi:hypothetical protein
MSRYALADRDAMFGTINYQMYNGRPNFILHVLCHPGLHFRSLIMKCDVEWTALRVQCMYMSQFIFHPLYGLQNKNKQEKTHKNWMFAQDRSKEDGPLCPYVYLESSHPI